MQITNGNIKYGRTVKTGDFESKRGDVELSFNIIEGEDIDLAVNEVVEIARDHLFGILGVAEDNTVKAKPAARTDTRNDAKPKEPIKATKRVPPAEKEKAPVVEEDPLADRAIPPHVAKEAAAAAKAAETTDVDSELEDLLGAPAVKEITDKEITDATQKCQTRAKNAPAIRKLMGELGVKVPPGRIIDLPQDKRKEFLDKLEEIKPLA